MSAVMDRTHEQRMEALRKANRHRSARAALKRSLQARETTVGAVLADPQPFVLTMRVLNLLAAQRGYGPQKARMVLLTHQISPVKTVGGLSVRQRALLVEALS